MNVFYAKLQPHGSELSLWSTDKLLRLQAETAASEMRISASTRLACKHVNGACETRGYIIYIVKKQIVFIK